MTATNKLMELVRQKKKALQQQSGRREKTTKPQPGKNRFRVLPGWRGEEDPTFFHDFGQHFVKDLSKKLKAVYMCTEKTFGRPCEICEAISEGIDSAADDDVINALTEGKSKGRVLMNALHCDGDDPGTPVILDLTPTTFEKVLEVMDEFGDITDLKEGTDIIINRTGSGLNTEYTVMPSPKSKAVKATVMEKLHNLDEYVKQEYDEGRQKALGTLGGVTGNTALLTAAASTEGDKPTTKVPDDSPFEESEVIEGEASVVEESAPEPAPEATAEAEPAPADDDLSDDDLDAMLADLEKSA